MSKVIKLLERLGEDSVFSSTSGEVDAVEQISSEMPAELATVLIAGDQSRLVALLGARTNVSCMVFPAKEDGQDDQEKREDEDDKDAPDDDSEKGLASNKRQAAVAYR